MLTAEGGRALGAGLGCYLIWGVIPLVFQAIGALGVSPWEMLAHRIVWSIPAAALFVLLARQGGQALAVLRQPRTLGWLLASALLIAGNWVVFMWAVTSGRVLETSLGYYINPLVNMAAGALIFRERINGAGRLAMGLALVGVVIQTVALGALPWVSIVLALSFGGYGIVRKQVAADAQTGLLVETLLIGALAAAYIGWQAGQGASHFGDPFLALLLILTGPGDRDPPGAVLVGRAAAPLVDHGLPAVHHADDDVRHRDRPGRTVHPPSRAVVRLHLGRRRDLPVERDAASARGSPHHGLNPG
ncbi:MAG: EamA family transporter RarD [Phenylobacterium sp.]|nr:EamA family transporter RarD [Phenylobacterium sp.]